MFVSLLEMQAMDFNWSLQSWDGQNYLYHDSNVMMINKDDKLVSIIQLFRHHLATIYMVLEIGDHSCSIIYLNDIWRALHSCLSIGLNIKNISPLFTSRVYITSNKS